jgi:iron complex outermembrane receptor protein
MTRTHALPLLLLAAATASAQTDSTLRSARVLDTLHVTATRITSPLPRTGRTLVMLDSALLHSAPRPEVSEVLRGHSLVDVRQRGPFDVQTDIGIRGGTFDQALVLVDGIPMTDPQTGHHQMNVPLMATDLERVEVLHGGASRTFGGGAFSGAVNLITREPLGRHGRFSAEGGSHGSYRAQLAQELGGAAGGVRLAAFTSHSDGHVPNSDFAIRGGQVSGVKRWNKLKLKGQLAGLHKRFGAQNFYSSLFPDQQEITGTWLGALELRNDRGPWPWSIRTYARRHNDQFQLFREGDGYYRYANGYFIRGEADTARFTPTFFYTFHNQHRTTVGGTEAQVRRAWTAGTTAAGMHLRTEHILSNVLGEPLSAPIAVQGTREKFTRGDERQNLALHVDHRWEHGRFGLDAGYLLNLNTAFQPEHVPGADAFFRWSGRHTTYASAGRAFRQPTWTDLYYNRGGAQGSLDLRPEHADQYELGHRAHGHGWTLQVALWRRQGRDLIDWVRRPGDPVVRAANITRVDLNGVELTASLNTTDQRGQGGVLYAYQWADQQAFPFTSLYVLDHLVHNAVLWWRQTFGSGFAAHASLTYRVRNGQYTRFADGMSTDYPNPLRIDLRLDRRMGPVGIFASVANLLDAEQMDRGNVPLPGRWLSAGASLHWGDAQRKRP